MSTKQYSFWEIISGHNIEIPAIQRDYAQGRKSEERIAHRLLSDLQAVLTDVSKSMNLHFVYGKTDGSYLIPLDGQQRLTTLFLLHWFLAGGELSVSEKGILSKFTYETRPSSEDFCRKLINEDFQFRATEKLSEQIKNQKWYYLSWKHDPTINAMLHMLDQIHEIFGQPDREMLDRLCSGTSPVQFHFLPLEHFKLDDKIYVKMNSRGKPLTEFENFKANFSVLLDLESKSKLDNEWLDIFWKLERNNREVDVVEVDRKYLNFFSNVTLNFLAESLEIDKKYKDTFDILDAYSLAYTDNTSRIGDLARILDALRVYEDTQHVFTRFLEYDPSYWERLRFYALGRFFILKGNPTEANADCYKKWMRVCGNLINNTLLQSAEDYYRAVRGIRKLSDHLDDLYEFMASAEARIEGFLQRQIEEELIKAHLLLNHPTWQDEILRLENHVYFSGQIGFVLELSRKADKYDEIMFRDYSQKLQVLFGESFKQHHDCLFQRALLTFGDYLVPVNHSRTFCTFNVGLREKMDNWRKVFDDTKRRETLRALLDVVKAESMKEDLRKCVEFCTGEDWRTIFITTPGIIEYCDKFRVFVSGNKVKLARSSADNWRRAAELYSYSLFLKLHSHGLSVSYEDSADTIPWIRIIWESKAYYIEEGKGEYTYGFCKGNSDKEGLEQMKKQVEGIISETKHKLPPN